MRYSKNAIIQMQNHRDFVLLEYLNKLTANSAHSWKKERSWGRKQAERENMIRRKSLLKEGIHADIIKDLSGCSPDYSCLSTACAVCVHYNQVGFVEEMAELFQGYKKLKHATVIFPQHMCKAGELHNIDPAVIAKCFYDQLSVLKKAQPNIVGIGCIEIVFRHPEELWHPHVHFVFAGCSKNAFRRCFSEVYRERYLEISLKEGVKVKPFRVTIEGNNEDDRVRLLAYLAKFTTSEIYPYMDVNNKYQKTGKRRPKNVAIENESLNWYHTHPFKSFIIRIGHRPSRIG